MAIKGKILGVGDGKVDTWGGTQRKRVTRKEEKKNKVGDFWQERIRERGRNFGRGAQSFVASFH